MAKINQESINEVLKKLKSTQKQVVTETGKALAKSCAMIQSTAIKSMRDTVTNPEVTYYSYNKTKPHHPSVPGNPPAVDTGTLRRSITYKVDENKLVGYVGSVLQNPPYGAYLEYGTTKDGKQVIKPRPWLRPAVKANLEEIKNLFASAVKVAIYDKR